MPRFKCSYYMELFMDTNQSKLPPLTGTLKHAMLVYVAGGGSQENPLLKEALGDKYTAYVNAYTAGQGGGQLYDALATNMARRSADEIQSIRRAYPNPQDFAKHKLHWNNPAFLKTIPTNWDQIIDW